MIPPDKLAQAIELTLLKPEATEADILRLCQQAMQHEFHAVCVNPCWVPQCVKALAEVDTQVCTVVGFPLGANHTTIKAQEAALAVTQGATEVDMVMNIGRFLQGDIQAVIHDMRTVAQAIPDHTLKVIIETSRLTEKEIISACKLARDASADFTKTSTGFSSRGASVRDVELMRSVEHALPVKAAGGIKTLAEAEALIAAGAKRLGCSRGVEIMRAAQAQYTQ